MATHLHWQVVLPKWGGGTREQTSAPEAVPVPEVAPEKHSPPNDLTDRDKVKKCLSKWTEYFTDHALRVTRTELKKFLSLVGMIDAYKALQCPGQCLECEGKISLTALPSPDGKWKCIQHLDSEDEPTGVKAGECDPEGTHSCPLCESIAFVHSDHCIGMCPLKADNVSALVGHKSTLGYVTSAEATEKARADNKAKKARKKEAEKLAEKEKSTRTESYDQQAFNEAWSGSKGKGSKGKGGGRGGGHKEKKHQKDKSSRKRGRESQDKHGEQA